MVFVCRKTLPQGPSAAAAQPVVGGFDLMGDLSLRVPSPTPLSAWTLDEWMTDFSLWLICLWGMCKILGHVIIIRS
jgi:hypothetical protein